MLNIKNLTTSRKAQTGYAQKRAINKAHIIVDSQSPSRVSSLQGVSQNVQATFTPPLPIDQNFSRQSESPGTRGDQQHQ